MLRHLFVLMVAMAMTACAGPQRVDNTVHSFARWDLPTGAAATAVPQAPQRYRFERLPSQGDGASAQEQDTLEAMARQSLEAHGWTLAEKDADARWTVQVSTSTTRTRDPWDERRSGWSLHGQIVAGNGHFFWSPMFMFPADPPDYQRQVSLLVRTVPGGQVVYETRAEHDSRWNSTPALWQAMLEAALKDFPKPPAGPRRVEVELKH